MCGSLSESNPSKIFLFEVVKVEITTAENLLTVLINLLNRDASEETIYSNFKVLITDKAPFCTLLESKLKLRFPALIDISC